MVFALLVTTTPTQQQQQQQQQRHLRKIACSKVVEIHKKLPIILSKKLLVLHKITLLVSPTQASWPLEQKYQLN